MRASDDIVLASRSLVLIEAAARTAFRRCRKLLTTDLAWPTYAANIASVGQSAGRHILTIPLRDRLLKHGLTAPELIEMVAAAYQANGCDALFLPAVDNLGVRLPVERIVNAIERRSVLRFVLIDAAQAFGHIPLAGILRSADFVVAGCHKWIGGYYPLGVGFAGGRGGRGERATIATIHDAACENDPLAGFLASLESDRFAQHSETVNLGPLFSCQGALDDLAELDFEQVAKNQHQSAAELRRIATSVGCHPVALDPPLLTGIQLIEIDSARPHRASVIERCLIRTGLVATAYDGGMVRLSVPHRGLTHEETSWLLHSLRRAKRGAITPSDRNRRIHCGTGRS